MSNHKVNGIVILDAIPDGELNTAQKLHEDLHDIADYKLSELRVNYCKVSSIIDLENCLNDTLIQICRDGLRPWLHIEGHGLADESGFMTANNEPCDWSVLKRLITPLNVALNLDLMLVLATCYGGSFVSAIETTEHAPVHGLIGPSREISVGEVADGFQAFYRELFETWSYNKALTALEASTSHGLYVITTAERFFYLVWESYKRINCTEKAILERARRMSRKLKRDGTTRNPRSLSDLAYFVQNPRISIN